MATETERKFLVAGRGWKKAARRSVLIEQAYLQRSGSAGVRVRIVDGRSAVLTVKAARRGLSRAEFEYPIPVADARQLLKLREGVVLRKRRHFVRAGRHTWEIDVFAGSHRGLVLAEIELSSARETFARPDWLGREVTHDRRYYNARLAGARP